MRDRDTTFKKKYFDEGLRDKKAIFETNVMTEDETGNQKINSARKKSLSCSRLLPSGVGATVCDCIAKTPYMCASKKRSETNISEADMEYVQITHAMEFLRIDKTVETAKRLVKMAASNAAVAGATSTVSVTSVVTVVGGTGAFVGAVVLMSTVLSPVYIANHMNKPTPSPSPYRTMIPKVQCPDAGAAMFAGYKVNNTYEDRQLLMVVLTDLPERLELFLTNSFSLPTMSEEFPGNKTGSVKMIIPSGGFSA
eukprot:scaffold274477_cov59-Attheya_sp.AAC.1